MLWVWVSEISFSEQWPSLFEWVLLSRLCFLLTLSLPHCNPRPSGMFPHCWGRRRVCSCWSTSMSCLHHYLPAFQHWKWDVALSELTLCAVSMNMIETVSWLLQSFCLKASNQAWQKWVQEVSNSEVDGCKVFAKTEANIDPRSVCGEVADSTMLATFATNRFARTTNFTHSTYCWKKRSSWSKDLCGLIKRLIIYVGQSNMFKSEWSSADWKLWLMIYRPKGGGNIPLVHTPAWKIILTAYIWKCPILLGIGFLFEGYFPRANCMKMPHLEFPPFGLRAQELAENVLF